MFTYGYIREATMAHLDIDEVEAQAMNIQSRFHIFANEAMQAICGGKPKYDYFKAKVVRKYAPLVMDGDTIRLATQEEIDWDEEEDGPREAPLLNTVQTREWYVEQGIYEVFDIAKMSDTFIAFADKQVWRIAKQEPSYEDYIQAEAFGRPLPKAQIVKERAELDLDFAYIGKNRIKFYKPGEYLVPARYLWFRFDSGIADDTEIDMPADIFLTIPLYVASVCLQIDNPQKASIKRSEFEMALARCTNTDFMDLNEVPASW